LITLIYWRSPPGHQEKLEAAGSLLPHDMAG